MKYWMSEEGEEDEKIMKEQRKKERKEERKEGRKYSVWKFAGRKSQMKKYFQAN